MFIFSLPYIHLRTEEKGNLSGTEKNTAEEARSDGDIDQTDNASER